MQEQARGQCALDRSGEAQPDPGTQFDDQSGRRGGRGQFDLHKADGRPALGRSAPPATAGGVAKTVPLAKAAADNPLAANATGSLVRWATLVRGRRWEWGACFIGPTFTTPGYR